MPALRFVVLGVPVEIQASFFVLMGALGLVTYRSPGGLVAWLVIALIAVLAHEAGHAAAFRAFGDALFLTIGRVRRSFRSRALPHPRSRRRPRA